MLGTTHDQHGTHSQEQNLQSWTHYALAFSQNWILWRGWTVHASSAYVQLNTVDRDIDLRKLCTYDRNVTGRVWSCRSYTYMKKTPGRYPNMAAICMSPHDMPMQEQRWSASTTTGHTQAGCQKAVRGQLHTMNPLPSKTPPTPVYGTKSD
jgi:hypothetical protein